MDNKKDSLTCPKCGGNMELNIEGATVGLNIDLMGDITEAAIEGALLMASCPSPFPAVNTPKTSSSLRSFWKTACWPPHLKPLAKL